MGEVVPLLIDREEVAWAVPLLTDREEVPAEEALLHNEHIFQPRVH